MSATPPPIITAILHGGPRDGESFEIMYGAKTELFFPHWETLLGKPVGDRYRLRVWRGQPTADYDYVEPAEKAA